MAEHRQLRSRPLGPEAARQLVVAAEQMGIETARIHVDADPAITTVETSRVDQKALGRPARRIAVAAAAGLVLGLVIGLIVVAVTDATAAQALLAFMIAGTVLGALAGLYSKLTMSTELADVDTGQRSTVRIDVDGLSSETADELSELMSRTSE